MASLSSMCRSKFGLPNLSRKSATSSVVTRPWQSYTTRASLEPPDVLHLAAKARISLTPDEVEEFGPKIGQVIGWFGKLQDVDLENVEPAIRADTDRPSNLRPDTPITFENREAMVAAVPMMEEPYIKVPKILKDNME